MNSCFIYKVKKSRYCKVAGSGLPRSLCSLAMTKRHVILNVKRERIRIPLKKNGLPQPFTRLRNDKWVWRNGLPRGLLTLAVPKSCFRLEREQLLTAAPAVARNDKGSESRKANCNDSKGLQA